MSLSEDNIIKLDVGGTRYKTTLNTLLSYPESMLSNMFSGRHKLNIDSDGYSFIDRDGEIFKYIIKFLRDKTLNLDGLSDSIIRDIITEADYYNITDLVVLCEKKIYHKCHDMIDDVFSNLFNFNISEFSREFNIIFSPDMLKKYDPVSRIQTILIKPSDLYKNININIGSSGMCMNNNNNYNICGSNYYKNFITTDIRFQLYKYDESIQECVWFNSIEINQEKKQALNFIKKWIKIFVNQDDNFKSFIEDFYTYYNINSYVKTYNIFNSIIKSDLINHPYNKIHCSIINKYEGDRRASGDIIFTFYCVI